MAETPAIPELKIAERYFNACRIESQLDEHLMKAFGATVSSEGLTMAGTPYIETDVDTWPCGHMVYDDYDSSFELWGIDDDNWTPSIEHLNAALDLGFSRCWLVYKDGTERYCTRDHIGDKKPSHSSRAGDAKYRERKLIRRLLALEQENKDLAREVDRQKALVLSQTRIGASAIDDAMKAEAALARVRALPEQIRKEADKDHQLRHGDDSGGIWAYQHEAAGRCTKGREIADRIDQALVGVDPVPQVSGGTTNDWRVPAGTQLPDGGVVPQEEK